MPSCIATMLPGIATMLPSIAPMLPCIAPMLPSIATTLPGLVAMLRSAATMPRNIATMPRNIATMVERGGILLRCSRAAHPCTARLHGSRDRHPPIRARAPGGAIFTEGVYAHFSSDLDWWILSSQWAKDHIEEQVRQTTLEQLDRIAPVTQGRAVP
jgi:hypothetical protein